MQVMRSEEQPLFQPTKTSTPNTTTKVMLAKTRLEFNPAKRPPLAIHKFETFVEFTH